MVALASNFQKINEDLVKLQSQAFTDLSPRDGAYVAVFLGQPYASKNDANHKKTVTPFRKPQAKLNQGLVATRVASTRQVTNEQREEAESMMRYLVEDLSVRLGRPAIWGNFKGDVKINTSILKQVFGYPVSIEATLAARFNQYLNQHAEIAESIAQRSLHKESAQRGKQKTANGVYSTRYSLQRMKNIQEQRTLFQGKSDQLDEVTMEKIIADLSKRPWAGMIKYDDHGFRSYHLDCADFLLEILSDVAEAVGDFPSLSTWRELSRSSLDLPTRSNLMQVLGPVDTWQEKMVEYRQRKLENPESIKQPRSTSRIRKSAAELEQLLQDCPWVEQMKNRSRYSVKADDLSVDACMEMMSDIIEANDGFLPNDAVIRELNYRMNIPSTQAFKPRIGLKKTWKESITAWRVANRPNRTYIPIQ